MDDEVVAGPVGVHRHDGGPVVGTEHLLRESVEFAEGVGTHEHHGHSSLLTLGAMPSEFLRLLI